MFTGWTHEDALCDPQAPEGAAPRRPAWPAAGAPAACAALALAAALFALTSGRYPLPLADVLRGLGAALGLVQLPDAQAQLLHRLLIDIRLPRVLAALAVGGALGLSGAAYQSVFRNPLVSPDLLGVMAGASAGAALGLVAGWPWPVVQGLAFGGGLLAVGVGVAIAQAFGGATVLMLVLGGIVSGALFTALLSLAKVLADPYNQLPGIVYWLMGSLGHAGLGELALAAPLLLPCALLLCLAGPWLDALAMGDDEARSLGLPAPALRLAVIALATLLSALTVALAGMIGWVGLVVPHAARLLAGPTNARLLPASACLGAAFLVGCDSLARSSLRAEVPIGIVTQLLGIPLFLAVLGRARRGWNG